MPWSCSPRHLLGGHAGARALVMSPGTGRWPPAVLAHGAASNGLHCVHTS